MIWSFHSNFKSTFFNNLHLYIKKILLICYKRAIKIPVPFYRLKIEKKIYHGNRWICRTFPGNRSLWDRHLQLGSWIELLNTLQAQGNTSDIFRLTSTCNSHNLQHRVLQNTKLIYHYFKQSIILASYVIRFFDCY